MKIVSKLLKRNIKHFKILGFLCLMSLATSLFAQETNLSKGDSLFARGHYSKAISIYKQHHPIDAVLYKIAKANRALGNFDAALHYYEQHLEKVPDDALIRFDYGKLLYKVKRYKEAAASFEYLIDLDGTNPNYHYEMGLAIEQQKDSTATYRSQNRYYFAFQLDTTHQKAIYKLAKHNLTKRKFDRVQYYTDVGLAAFENNRKLISLQAQNYYLMQRYDKAIATFEKLLELNESTFFIHAKLSQAYRQLSDYPKAIEHTLKAMTFEPENVGLLFSLGKLYERNNEFEKAQKCLLTAISLRDVPLDMEYMELGYVYNLQKKSKEAIQAYDRAVKENPENDQAFFFLILTKDRYYKDQEAIIKAYESFQKKFPKSNYIDAVNSRLSQLKEENFLKTD